MHFLSTVLEQDAEGNDIAKQGLTEEERKRLLDLDEGIFMCEGKHMIKNYATQKRRPLVSSKSRQKKTELSQCTKS